MARGGAGGRGSPVPLTSSTRASCHHMRTKEPHTHGWQLRRKLNEILGHCAIKYCREQLNEELFQLQLYKESAQTFRNLGETMRNFGKALNKKTSLRSETRIVSLGDEASHAQRGCGISAFISCTTSKAKHMMGRIAKITLQP